MTVRGRTTSTAATVPDGIEGTWNLGAGSQAGYRVQEVLFGQEAEAVGRTQDVTGTLEISGTTVTTTEVTVDMTTVASAESRRDGQFKGRIMDTATYPTATFALTEPIELGSVAADGEEVTHRVTGDLTLRGVTNEVTFELTARRNGANIEANGTIADQLRRLRHPRRQRRPGQRRPRRRARAAPRLHPLTGTNLSQDVVRRVGVAGLLPVLEQAERPVLGDAALGVAVPAVDLGGAPRHRAVGRVDPLVVGVVHVGLGSPSSGARPRAAAGRTR